MGSLQKLQGLQVATTEIMEITHTLEFYWIALLVTAEVMIV
jgi:hypothetical protein